MVIFELSGVDFLEKYLKITISSKFENFEKYYTCMLNFRQICFWENFNVGQTVLDTDSTTLSKIR